MKIQHNRFLKPNGINKLVIFFLNFLSANVALSATSHSIDGNPLVCSALSYFQYYYPGVGAQIDDAVAKAPGTAKVTVESAQQDGFFYNTNILSIDPIPHLNNKRQDVL